MNLLLDTKVALWALSAPEKLGAIALAALRDPRNRVAVSTATVWEVEFKRATGRLEAPDDFASEFVDRGFEELPVTSEHATTAGRLPFVHADPFDRTLIGQAIVEGLRIVTADPTFAEYDVLIVDPSR